MQGASDSSPPSRRLELVPISLKEAHAFVAEHHRHHQPSVGGKFAIGCALGDDIRGVIVVGRPVARGADDTWTAEVTRCCTDGTKHVASKLYAAAWRAARAMGYRKMITYTLADETGVSVSAAGFKVVAQTRGGSWNCRSRPRVDKHPLQQKLRWEIG